jgi:hypothetical protein
MMDHAIGGICEADRAAGERPILFRVPVGIRGRRPAPDPQRASRAMLTLPPSVRICLARGVTDMRKASIPVLMGLT